MSAHAQAVALFVEGGADPVQAEQLARDMIAFLRTLLREEGRQASESDPDKQA